jgi:hypothetical protein
VTYTADIGNGPEAFDSLDAVSAAVYSRVSGLVSSAEWYGKIRTSKGAAIKDAGGKVVARVSYNARLWTADGKTELGAEVSR